MAYTTRTNDSTPAMPNISSTPVSAPSAISQAPRVPHQEKKSPCNKEGCLHVFDTLEAMKLHKKYDPEHFYCKKCDFDAEDWEDLTNHKIENMAPYLEGVEGKVKKFDEDLKHIACEFCGEDFKSFGGRKRHRQQSHPADQDIKCPGCQGKYIRASHLIEHLEKGDCTVITARIFHSHLQQKFVVAQIMSAPDKFNKPRTMLTDKPPASHSGVVTDGSETLDQDFGGVSLMDQQDEAQMGGRRPMEAEKNLIDLHAQSAHEAWPRIPSQNLPQESKSVLSPPNGARAAPAIKKAGGGVALGRSQGHSSGGNAYTETYPSLSSKQSGSMTGEDYDDDTASEYTATSASVKGAPKAWGTSQTSRALFPNARSTPKTQPKAGDWEGILAQRADAETNEGANMLKVAWWDPTSKDYDISRFRHPVHEAYYCPFPACEDALHGNSFHSQSDIESHIKYCHTLKKYRCPACFKHFQSAARLIAHAESTRKCGIRGSDRFQKFLDEFTGGFLKSKYVGEPKIYRPETSLVKEGQPTGGIISTKFISKDPYAA